MLDYTFCSLYTYTAVEQNNGANGKVQLTVTSSQSPLSDKPITVSESPVITYRQIFFLYKTFQSLMSDFFI